MRHGAILLEMAVGPADHVAEGRGTQSGRQKQAAGDHWAAGPAVLSSRSVPGRLPMPKCRQHRKAAVEHHRHATAPSSRPVHGAEQF